MHSASSIRFAPPPRAGVSTRFTRGVSEQRGVSERGQDNEGCHDARDDRKTHQCSVLRSDRFTTSALTRPCKRPTNRSWPLSKKQRPRGVFSRGHPWVGELFCFGVSDSHPEPSVSQTQNGTRFSRTDHDLSTVFAVNTCGKSNNVFMSSVQTDSKAT